MPDSQTDISGASPVTENADVKVAESSAAEPGDKGSQIKSTLDLVKSLQGPDKSPASDNGQDTKPAPIETDVKPVNPAEAEAKAEEEWLKTLSKESQKRFRSLANAKREAAEKVAGFAEKEEKFGRYEQVIQQNQLSDEDVNNGFEIMGLLRSSPEEALKRLTPIVRGLLDFVGYTLPDDLKADVEAGALTQDRARELAAARKRNERSEATTKAQAEQQQANQQRQAITTMARTADDWAAKQKTSDPDWHLKQDRVAELTKLHILEKGMPNSDADAVRLFEDVKKRVDADLRKFRPNPQPKSIDTGASSSSATPEPKSTLDVIRQMAGGNRN